MHWHEVTYAVPNTDTNTNSNTNTNTNTDTDTDTSTNKTSIPTRLVPDAQDLDEAVVEVGPTLVLDDIHNVLHQCIRRLEPFNDRPEDGALAVAGVWGEGRGWDGVGRQGQGAVGWGGRGGLRQAVEVRGRGARVGRGGVRPHPMHIAYAPPPSPHRN